MFCVEVFACTSAIFTGKVTADGRPIMWKNRDTGELNNRLQTIKGEKYTFTALVNSFDKHHDAWGGSNEAGFCIMNTASYNLAVEKLKVIDGEGELMKMALGVCRTLKDFEDFLNSLHRPMPIEANFGVIDAEGGAAYYEVNSRNWSKTDVNDPHIAPEGYIVYTNYSYTGSYDKGMGYIRYTNADNIVKKAVGRHTPITPKWIMDNLSRSFYNSVLDIDLCKSEITSSTGGWFIDQDFIPRKSTSAIVIFQGVKPSENPLHTIFWCALGYGPLAVTIPVFMQWQKEIPSVMLSKDNALSTCELCDMVLKVKEEVFPILRGNGSKYFMFGKLYNSECSGYMQRLAPAEAEVFSLAEPLCSALYSNNLSESDVTSFNSKVCEITSKAYKGLK